MLFGRIQLDPDDMEEEANQAERQAHCPDPGQPILEGRGDGLCAGEIADMHCLNGGRKSRDGEVAVALDRCLQLGVAEQNGIVIAPATAPTDELLLPAGREPADTPDEDMGLRRQAEAIRCRDCDEAAGADGTINLADIGRVVADMLDHVERDDRGQRTICERQCLCDCGGKDWNLASVADHSVGNDQPSHRDINADTLAVGRKQRDNHRTIPAPKVQNRPDGGGAVQPTRHLLAQLVGAVEDFTRPPIDPRGVPVASGRIDRANHLLQRLFLRGERERERQVGFKIDLTVDIDAQVGNAPDNFIIIDAWGAVQALCSVDQFVPAAGATPNHGGPSNIAFDDTAALLYGECIRSRAGGRPITHSGTESVLSNRQPLSR